MILRKLIKKDAKRALKDSFSKAIAITLLLAAITVFFYLLESLLYFILDVESLAVIMAELSFPINTLPDVSILGILLSGASALLSFILMVPLNLGVKKWYYELSSGNSRNFDLIFYYLSSFKLYCRSLWYAINMTVRSFFWILVFLLPGIACLAAGIYLYQAYDHALYLSVISMLLVISVFLWILGIVFAFINLQKYFIAPYMVNQDDNESVLRCFKASTQYSKGFRSSFAWFHLSFLGWYILSILILPILYALPYREASYAIYAKYIIQKGTIANFKKADTIVN